MGDWVAYDMIYSVPIVIIAFIALIVIAVLFDRKKPIERAN